MKVLKRSLNVVGVVACILSCFILYGCGASSLGPQEPLLPTIDGQSKFSDRFQLEEEPQFFYDLFGKELLEGNEVFNYRERKEFNQNGELIAGWTGQLDSERFSAQLDRTILTTDSFRGRHTEFAIGDNMRIKPSTLFPNRYIIFKTEFDGFRWDISFSQERHLFTLLNSRISNPVRLSDAAANLAPTLGRRNGLNDDAGIRHIENARMIGFRAQGLLGDIFRVGFTYMNLHKEHPERVENPLLGTVANTPPENITVVFRDDSPEDNHPRAFLGLSPTRDPELIQGGVGAAVKDIKVTIVTQAEGKISRLDRIAGVDPPLLPEETTVISVTNGSFDLNSDITAVPGSRRPRDSVDGLWKIVDGFNAMQYNLVFANHDIEPRQVKSVEFDLVVAGDYNIVVVGASEANKAEDDPELQEWIKTEDGHIEMPFRDVIEAPGNYGQSAAYTDHRANLVDNPSEWTGTGRPRKIHYRYGAARAAILYGLDLEGTLFNTFIRAHYSINSKYKQYPTVPKDKVGFSRLKETIVTSDGEEATGISVDRRTLLPEDANGVPTYSETEGERFEAKLGGDGTAEDSDGEMGREVAWFINLKQRFGRLFLEETFYHIDPGYTTTYRNWGANSDRDQTYSLPRTPESSSEVDPFDEIDYQLIEDDDDDDDWPDDIDFDGVLPRADDRDQNGVLDFQEDFLIFEADPPIFTDLVDLNNNGTIDSLEDDFEPQYEYGIDREGYHLIGSYDLLDNLTFKVGWLNESEVSSRRKNDSRYLHVTYQRDIPDFGTILFQNRLVRIKDDIPDYTITLRVGELEPIQLSDELDFFNSRVNTTTLQFLYTAIPNLTLEAKFLVVLQKQFQPDDEDAIALNRVDDEEATQAGNERNERVDFMIPIEQVRDSGDKREFPFYPDHGVNPLDPGDTGLIYDNDNWKPRRYDEKTIRNQVTILRAKYEIPLGDLGFVKNIGEDLTLTPMAKYIWEKVFDHTANDVATGVYVSPLNARLYVPTDPEPIEYLRFNKRSREDVLGVRLDYQFTQRMNVLGGFQYRKFTNRDNNFKTFLANFPSDEDVPILFRPNIRTRIFEIQAINRGEWLGFNIVILAGYRRTTILLEDTTSNTTFVRAMMGF
jgi:hypothetical protein